MFCPLLAFASSHKLPKEAHRLTGLLAGATTEVPDSLRSKDFQARQLLHGLLFTHESLKFNDQIATSALTQQHSQPVKAMNHVSVHGCIPTIQTMIINQLQICKEIRHLLRQKAAASVQPRSVQISLTDGDLFSTTLFKPSAVAKAEDGLRNTPPTLTIDPKCLIPQPSSSTTRGSYRSRSSVLRGRGSSFRGRGNYQASSTQRSFHTAPTRRGTRPGTFSSHRASHRGSY